MQLVWHLYSWTSLKCPIRVSKGHLSPLLLFIFLLGWSSPLSATINGLLSHLSSNPSHFCFSRPHWLLSYLCSTLHLRVTLLTSTTCLSRPQTPFPVDCEVSWFRDITCSTSLFSICTISEMYNSPNYLNRSAWACACVLHAACEEKPFNGEAVAREADKDALRQIGEWGKTWSYFRISLLCHFSPCFLCPIKTADTWVYTLLKVLTSQSYLAEHNVGF